MGEIHMSPDLDRAGILESAKEIVCGARSEIYGGPEESFGVIAALWEVYVEACCVGSSAPVNVSIRPEDVAAMMALLKIARISSGGTHADSWIDLAGYAACGGEISNR